MTWKWSKTSLDRLVTCDKRLQDLADMMLERSSFDLKIMEGYRTKDAQEKAYREGRSRARFGESLHNVFPSKAVDIIPCSPINWDDKDPRWIEMALNAMWCAGRLNCQIVWGGSFKSIKDFPHFQIKE